MIQSTGGRNNVITMLRDNVITKTQRYSPSSLLLPPSSNNPPPGDKLFLNRILIQQPEHDQDNDSGEDGEQGPCHGAH